jgi:hypothetical protein
MMHKRVATPRQQLHEHTVAPLHAPSRSVWQATTHHPQIASHPIGSATLGVRKADSTQELQHRGVRLLRRPLLRLRPLGA